MAFYDLSPVPGQTVRHGHCELLVPNEESDHCQGCGEYR